MGKKTLYHPVSLHAIRGALEFCGWRVGRLHQTWSNMDLEKAGYTADLVEVPSDLPLIPLWKLARLINGCFSDDIKVMYVYQRYDMQTEKTTTAIALLVDIHQDTPMEQAIKNAIVSQ